MIRVYRLNCGSTGAEDIALAETVRISKVLTWAVSPHEADVFVLTGPITRLTRPALLRIWQDLIVGRRPLVALGRSSIDGHPFGRGGIAELPDVVSSAKLDGSAPALSAIQSALIDAVRNYRRAH